MSTSIPPSGAFSQLNPPMQNGCGSAPKSDSAAQQSKLEEALEQLGIMWEPPGKDGVPPGKAGRHGHGPRSHAEGSFSKTGRRLQAGSLRDENRPVQGEGAAHAHGSDAGCGHDKGVPGGKVPPGLGTLPPGWQHSHPHTPVAGGSTAVAGVNQLGQAESLMKAFAGLMEVLKQLAAAVQAMKGSTSSSTTPPPGSSSSSSPTVTTPPSPPTNLPVS